MLLFQARFLSRALTRRMSTTNNADGYLLFPTSKHPQIPVDKLWATARPRDKTGEIRLFYNEVQGNPGALAAIVSLGDAFDAKPENNKREAVRRAIGNGVKQLRDAGAKDVAIDDSADPQATGMHYPLYVPCD